MRFDSERRAPASYQPQLVAPRQRVRWARDVIPGVSVQLVASIGAVFFLFPFLWMVLTSLKSLPEISQVPPTIFPQELDLSSYPRALTTIPFLVYLQNTLIICFGVIVGKLVS